MVKSSVSAMPKRRKTPLDPELIKELDDWDRRYREFAPQLAVAIARADDLLRRLRERAARR